MKLFVFLLLSAASLSACAQPQVPAATAQDDAPATASSDLDIQPGTPEARVQAALAKMFPEIPIARIGQAPIAGFRQVIIGGQVVYVSDDGRYLLHGTLIDLERERNLSNIAMAGLRRELLAKIPDSGRIVFAPANPDYTVTVFTDVDCGFCRKLHSQIADYNAQGIAVEYLAFPRMGPGSANFEEMVAVWCADDRRQALTTAKNDGKVDGNTACDNPVAMHYALGMRMGLTGTPMILAEDGTQLGGYVPPANLRAMLDEHAAEADAADAPAAQGTPASTEADGA